MACRCEKLRELMRAVGGEEWLVGSSTCWFCSPHFFSSSSQLGRSRPSKRVKGPPGWSPSAAIPREASPEEHVGEVRFSEAEDLWRPIKRP
jgi:hypothetical protein